MRWQNSPGEKVTERTGRLAAKKGEEGRTARNDVCAYMCLFDSKWI